MLVWPRRWVRPARVSQTSVRSVRRVGASGGGRVVPASGDDCHTPAPGPRDPSTNHVAPCPARTRRTGYPRRPGRSGSDCCDTPYHRRSLPETADRQRWPARLRPLGRGDGGLDDPWCRRHRHLAVSPRQSRRSPCRRHARLCAPDAAAIFHLRDLPGSWGFVQSVFEVFFFRFRSSRARPSRVGVSIPEAFARPARNAW